MTKRLSHYENLENQNCMSANGQMVQTNCTTEELRKPFLSMSTASLSLSAHTGALNPNDWTKQGK